MSACSEWPANRPAGGNTHNGVKTLSTMDILAQPWHCKISHNTKWWKRRCWFVVTAVRVILDHLPVGAWHPHCWVFPYNSLGSLPPMGIVLCCHSCPFRPLSADISGHSHWTRCDLDSPVLWFMVHAFHQMASWDLFTPWSRRLASCERKCAFS